LLGRRGTEPVVDVGVAGDHPERLGSRRRVQTGQLLGRFKAQPVVDAGVAGDGPEGLGFIICPNYMSQSEV